MIGLMGMSPSGWLAGVPVYLSNLLVETVPFSRSPSRARRRARQGHPQHYATRPMAKAIKLEGGAVIMHPALFSAIRAKYLRDAYRLPAKGPP